MDTKRFFLRLTVVTFLNIPCFLAITFLCLSQAIDRYNLPPIHINITYFIQTSGLHKSSLATNHAAYSRNYDGNRLKNIDRKVAEIWTKAGIFITRSDSNELSVVTNDIPVDFFITHRGRASGTDPKNFRDSLHTTEQLIEGLFLYRATFSWVHNPELAIHLVGSLRSNNNARCTKGNYANVLGVFVPEHWRRCFTSKVLQLNSDHSAAANASAYIIIAGDDHDSFSTNSDIASTIVHAIGHAFGLNDEHDPDDTNNLMYWSHISGSPMILTDDQIRNAREGARIFTTYGSVSTFKSLCRFQVAPVSRR